MNHRPEMLRVSYPHPRFSRSVQTAEPFGPQKTTLNAYYGTVLPREPSQALRARLRSVSSLRDALADISHSI